MKPRSDRLVLVVGESLHSLVYITPLQIPIFVVGMVVGDQIAVGGWCVALIHDPILSVGIASIFQPGGLSSPVED